MAGRGAQLYCATKVHGGGIVSGFQLERFKPHRHRVLNLYKRALGLIEFQWGSSFALNTATPAYHMIPYEQALLRARFENNKHITNLGKATELLKDGEEEYWINQGDVSFRDVMLPLSDGGIAYGRWTSVQKEQTVLDLWGAQEWARYPDIYDNYKKWNALRNETWDEEMNTMEDYDAKTIAAGERLNNEFPAAKAADGPPPFWWRYVTRPIFHVNLAQYDYTDAFHKNV